ncbi:DUF1648 domain-containing protein [Actinobacteria bacterium YIM 96077]|uniref:DUF1648 domain-containing protein n=1 Tax=Phytoactinopolyspora halophila TaxID=1981511 RepID=A0A329R1Q4_9ACTN|nr:DUF1648 domain-containing protein [Actinobacteria bacterium YIM 96077]RAW18116.1 DUF1648 domain-containing protein [Phytoactinopolyspora halophila]
MAAHWGPDGVTRTEPVGVTAGILVGLGLLLALIGLVYVLSRHAETNGARTIAGTMSGTTAFVTVLVTGLVAGQRELADPFDASISPILVIGSLGAGVAVAAVAALLIPRWTHNSRMSTLGEKPTVPLAGSERAAWTQRVVAGSPAIVALLLGAGLIAAVAVITTIWGLLIPTGLLFAVIGAMYSIRVTVDERGLSVRSGIGWPRWRIPLDDIRSASVVPVRPIRHFGGYGVRIAALAPYQGTVGVILRGGDAVLVERDGASPFLVVVDDADTAAGLINSLLERTRD